MNIALWIVQLLLALLELSGGAYKTFAFDEVARHLTAIPHAGWRAFGVFEMIGGVLLVVLPLTRWKFITPMAASALAVEAFALALIYAQYSLEIAATNPLVWAVVLGVLAMLVAYGRRNGDAGHRVVASSGANP